MSKFYISAKIWTIKDNVITWNDALYMFEAANMNAALRQAHVLLSKEGKSYEVESVKIELEKFPLAANTQNKTK